MLNTSEFTVETQAVGMVYQKRRGSLFRSQRPKESEEWSLSNVTLALKPGDRLGILGRNGSGKSTLLKLISGVLVPTTGTVTTRGRLASMLELGCGFHPDLSGRQNVYFTGALLGRSRRTIAGEMEEILEFSGLKPDYLDRPVSRYSSGMKLRLAFSATTHFKPEILVIDEALSVGDQEFQGRCLTRISELAEQGTTILASSHSPSVLRQLCNRAIFLDKGKVVVDGSPDDAIDYYTGSGLIPKLESLRPKAAGLGSDDIPVVCTRVSVNSECPDQAWSAASPIRVVVEYRYDESHPANEIAVVVSDEEGRTLLVSQSSDSNPEKSEGCPAGNYRATCRIPGHTFGKRRYYLSVEFNFQGRKYRKSYPQVLAFEINFRGHKESSHDYDWAWFRPLLEWRVESTDGR